MNDDLISRQQAIDEVIALPNCENGYSDTYDKGRFISLLEELPSAEKRGKWIDIDSQMYTWKCRCSECGYERSMMSTQGRYPHFCENCGAYMER